MTSLPPDITDKILKSNADVHKIEATMYDCLHPEIFGSYEQRQTNRDLEMIAARLPKDRIIHAMDIGCGTGNLTLKYIERGYRVRAVDLSPEMLACLSSKIPLKARSLVNAVPGNAFDALSCPETREFYDVISFSSVLHHLPDYMVVLSLALQQLRPGGFLWVCHEPESSGHFESRATIAGALLKWIDNRYILTRKALVYLLFAIKKLRRPIRIDYSWSDYHAREGISSAAVLKSLESYGASIVFYETYNSRFSTLLAWLDQKLQILPHQHFRFIAQTPLS